MLGDPLTPVTGLGFGKALGPGGQALKRAGILDDLTRASGMGSREFLSSRTLADVLPKLNPEQMAKYETAAAKFGQLDEAAPLGGQLGFGVPFKDPAFTIGSPGAGRAIDRFGSGLSTLPPVRLASAAFDYSTKGRVAGEEQDWARRITREVERSSPQGVKNTIKASRAFNDLGQEFADHFGDDLFRQMDDIDPRVLDEHINATLAEKMAAWQDPAMHGERLFRQKHIGMLSTLRRLRNEGKDFTALKADGTPEIPHFDQLYQDLSEFTGRTDLTTDDVLDVLERTNPRPTRETVTPEARRRAGQGVLEGAEGAPPWKQGDVVLAADRENYGWVQKVGPRTSQVMFRNPESGVVALKNMPNDMLTRAFEAGSDEAANFSRLAVAKVFNDIMRHIGETGNAEEAFRFFASDSAAKVSPAFLERMQSTMADLKGATDTLWSSIESLGGKTRWLNMDRGSMIDHVYRQWFPMETEAILRREGKMAPHTFEAMRGRTPEIRELPAAIVKQLTQDTRYRGENAARHILEDFEDKLDTQWLLRHSDEADNTDFLLDVIESTPEDNIAAHAEALAAWVRNRPAMETRLVTEDAADYFRKGFTVEATLRASHDFLFDAAQKYTGSEGMSLHDVFKYAGMNTDTALQHFSDRFGMSVDQARRLRVDADSARAVTGLSKLFDEKLANTFLEPFLKHFDRWTRSFKTHVTVPWPAFFVRNLGSGQFVNASSGYINGITDLAQYGKAFGQASDLLKKARTGSITPAEQDLLDTIHAYAVFQKQQGFSDVEHFVPSGQDWLPEKVTNLRAHRQAARDFVEVEPTMAAGVPGVNPAHRGLRTVVQAGTAANQNVEWFNRVPMFLYLKGKGYADGAAAEVVEKLHFDYSRLSPTEKEVFKRAAPFYTFTKRAAALVFDTLMERPGGALAQTIRATSQGQTDEPAPEYVRQTAAIPIGTLDDGSQRYLTGFGLAHEDPLSFGGGGVRGTLAEVGSRLNPLIKGPLEWTFNESLFQRGPLGGRDLGDMDPTIGRTLQNIGLQEPGPVGRAKPFLHPGFEHLAVNTPASRLLNTTRTLTDPRKYQATGGVFDAVPGQALAMQLLTGIRQTDISPQQRLRELREQIDSIISEEGGYVGRNVTFTKEQIKQAEETDHEAAARMKQLMAAKRELQRLLKQDEKPKVRLRRAG